MLFIILFYIIGPVDTVSVNDDECLHYVPAWGTVMVATRSQRSVLKQVDACRGTALLLREVGAYMI